jgi:CubicO group peptidase (beta-lactamase class C family)
MTETQLEDRLRVAGGGTVPGVTMVVVGPGGVLARASVGLADLASGRPVGSQTAFPWFSMTKLVTATTAVRLAERGALELDAPVLPLVPAMNRLRPARWAARITVRQLLQHAAGLSNPVPVRWIHPAGRPAPDPDTILATLLSRHRRLRFEPGARSSYSNLGALLVGRAIAQAAGAPFESVVDEEILRPLAMAATGFAFPAGIDAATGYHPRRSPMRWLLPRWVAGSVSGRWLSFRPFLVDGAPYGGLVGMVEDAARFLRMHLRDGELDGSRVISADGAAQMRSITARGRRFDLGLGWFTPAAQRSADPPFVEHLGGGAGFYNVMRLYPSRAIGVVVMGNATKYDVDAVARLALESP